MGKIALSWFFLEFLHFNMPTPLLDDTYIGNISIYFFIAFH
jgi:hypothetical protein